MNFKKEVDYRLAKWVFFNIYQEGKIDGDTYHLLIKELIAACDPPMKSIEEEVDSYEREED